jgi:hypothetical protein
MVVVSTDGGGKTGRTPTMQRMLASLGAAAVLATGAVALTPTGASAAPNGCWGSGPRDSRYCHTYQGGNVMFNGAVAGWLNAGDNWFVCQRKFPGQENPPVGDARNDWWLWTQADTNVSNGGWGWFPANKISGGVNYGEIPGLRTC